MLTNNYSELEQQLGHKFKDINLLIRALTHSSASSTDNYDRMEFLGDSLLSVFVAEYLYDNLAKPVGYMSVLRSQLVSTHALSKIVIDNGWTKYIIFGGSILGAHNMAKKSLADVFESITAAIYLDAGFEETKKFVTKFVLSGINTTIDTDFKTKLQEKLACIDNTLSIKYVELEHNGPSHDMTFKMGLYINDRLVETSIGKSKKEADQNCAKIAYENICKYGLEKYFK